MVVDRWILCGLLLQVGAIYRAHEPGRDSTLEVDWPQGYVAKRALQQPSWVNLSPFEPLGNDFDAFCQGFHVKPQGVLGLQTGRQIG